MSKAMLNLPVETMYQQWLGGLSIRKIARYYQVGRMAVWGAFNRTYGKNACNLRKQSLARVVFQEYGDMVLAERVRGIDGLFRTTATDNNYSQFQTTDLNKHHLASLISSDSQRGELNLVLYRQVTILTAHIIYLTIWNRTNRHFGNPDLI